MSAQSVDWVLIVRYGISAHRATYGRLSGNSYTKDYIQLSRKKDFIADLAAAFPAFAKGAPSVAIEFRWPTGSAGGTIFRRSADRPHLAWETNCAPAPWKMANNPSVSSTETIRGDPSRKDEVTADREFTQLMSSNFGQPFLVAVKLAGDDPTLHLRVYIQNPTKGLEWADVENTPKEVRELILKMRKTSALDWRLFSHEKGSPKLFFDPSRKVDPWSVGGTSASLANGGKTTPKTGEATPQVSEVDNDSIAERLDYSEEEVAQLEARAESGNYEVPDSFSTVKTRGSAQQVFAKKVKSNYDGRCALTGISSAEFLVASHIVPWSVDQKIRLDPSNGICFSVLIDRAFENGYLQVEDDLTVTIDLTKIGSDAKLRKQLESFHGAKLTVPKKNPPSVAYLKRRRGL